LESGELTRSLVGPRRAKNSIDSLTEAAYQALKRDIVRCDLEPGRRVTEVELVDRYQTGRAAVRTALSRLYQERLVEVLPRQGYVIAPITLKHVRDSGAVRLLLEPPAAQAAAGRTDIAELRRLEAEYRAHEDFGHGEHLEAFMQANAAFHLAVARASDNRRLVDMIAGLLVEMERSFHLAYRLRNNAVRFHEMNHVDHAEIIQALADNDAPRAGQLMADHIAATDRLIIEGLLGSAVLETVNLTLERAPLSGR
jgi:DNA-binding GntR family transcriptional regulator